jgi:signal peptidase I
MATKTARSDAPRSETRETVRFLLKLALFVFVFRTLVIASFVIPSESMLPRLLVGDYLFVSKWNYGYSRWSFPFGVPPVPGSVLNRLPTRGDVVVFRAPEVLDHDVVKRVIGLPGDTIQMRRGQLILNGQAVPKQRVADYVLPLTPNFPAVADGPNRPECGAEFVDVDAGRQVCRYPQFRETLPGGATYTVLDQGQMPDRDDTDLYTVPADHVFVMGDNRDDSGDSRFAPPGGMGYVPVANLEGKVLVTFFSTDGSAEWIKPWTWFTAARPSRIGG